VHEVEKDLKDDKYKHMKGIFFTSDAAATLLLLKIKIKDTSRSRCE
jgi:hypothetical protein